MRLEIILALAMFASGAATAQDSVFLPDASATTGTCTCLPFGAYDEYPIAKNQKYQTLVPWQQLRTLSRPYIEEIGFAACHTGVHHFDTITIRLASVSVSTLSPEFAKNLGSSPSTVLTSKDYYWHHQAGMWSRIGLQAPFPLTPGQNLVVDIEVTGGVFLNPAFAPSKEDTGSFRRADNVPRLYAIDWKSAPPKNGTPSPRGLKLELASRTSALDLFGRGCKGTGAVAPFLGLAGNAAPSGTVRIELSSALALSPALLVLGASNRPPFPLPLLGFPGCSLYQTVDVALATATDSNGKASVLVPLPATAALSNQRFYSQFFQAELGNSTIGLRASNYGRVLIK